MGNDATDLCQLARAFVASGEPVSFYDAFALVRLARRAGELDDEALAALIALHDHPCTTDGGRGVLAELLRGLAARREKERGLAARVVRPKDSGRVARARAGAKVRLAVACDDLTADAWEVVRLEGPARLTRLTPAAAASERADYELELLAPGAVVVELASRAPAPRGPRAPSRELVLRVVVEP